MTNTTHGTLIKTLREAAHRLEGARADYDPLMELIGDARFVLLGEASHGTHDFYHMRTQITKRLIEEKGFTAVAVEADWPDAYRVNRYVEAVLGYLSKVDPQAAQRARYRYSCFDHFGENTQAYGYAASFDLSASCAEEALGPAH